MTEGIKIIRNNPVLEDAFRFIMLNNTSNSLPYHNFTHLLTVLKYANYIAIGEGCYYDELLPLHLAALFHDVDHLGGKQKNDSENISRALKAFRTFYVTSSVEISEEIADKVDSIIEATQYPYVKPHSAIGQFEHIIRDADMMQQFENNWLGHTTLGLALEANIPIEEFIPKQRLFLEEMKFLTKTARDFKKDNWSNIMDEFRILEVSILKNKK